MNPTATATTPARMTTLPTENVEVVIIGTGFSGLCTAIQLKKAGIHNFVMLERASEVGGTWRDNTYPGCACDIPSHLYSFSFERRGDWTRKYPEQEEILAYQKHCAQKYNLYPHIRFNTDVVDAAWNAADGKWVVRTAAGETYTGRSLISCVGGLTRPAIPDIPGRDTFHGPAFHSAEWNHDYDLAGKRVAVIGTGASAIQIVPEIADTVEQLYVFQRTAPWIFPKPDRPFAEWERRLLTYVPGLERLYRSFVYWFHELRAFGFLGKRRMMGKGEEMGRKFIRAEIADPELRKAVTPNFPLGCKRVLMSNEWYATLGRDDVHLVTDDIAAISPTGVVTADGTEHEVDAIVYSTGFKATEWLVPLKVYGAGEKELSEEWREGAKTNLGITVNGFPNFFIVFGPNTGLGHNSMVFMIEAQVRYTVKCIKKIVEENLRSLEIRADVQSAFQDEVQSKLQNTVWMSGCQSWYQSADGKIYTLWPGFTVEYWWRTHSPKFEDFATN